MYNPTFTKINFTLHPNLFRTFTIKYFQINPNYRANSSHSMGVKDMPTLHKFSVIFVFLMIMVCFVFLFLGNILGDLIYEFMDKHLHRQASTTVTNLTGYGISVTVILLVIIISLVSIRVFLVFNVVITLSGLLAISTMTNILTSVLFFILFLTATILAPIDPEYTSLDSKNTNH